MWEGNSNQQSPPPARSDVRAERSDRIASFLEQLAHDLSGYLPAWALQL